MKYKHGTAEYWKDWYWNKFLRQMDADKGNFGHDQEMS